MKQIANQIAGSSVPGFGEASVTAIWTLPLERSSLPSGKRFPSVDFCMSGPSGTPRAVPAHNPAKSGMWFSVSIGTYLALMTNPCHKLSSHSEFVRYLRTILSSVHLTFLHSGTIPAIFFIRPMAQRAFQLPNLSTQLSSVGAFEIRLSSHV